MAANGGNNIIIEAGETPYEDMVKNIEKGIIVDGFSGGYIRKIISKYAFLYVICNGGICEDTQFSVGGNSLALFAGLIKNPSIKNN